MTFSAGKGVRKHIIRKVPFMGWNRRSMCERGFTGLCFVNLVDFDALWGHRRNVEGYGKEIEKFDEKLGVLLE